MREVQGYPLPLGEQISKDRVNFSIAVAADKDCQLLLYRTGRKKPCRQFDMKPMIGEVRCIALEDIQPGDYEYNYLINKEVVTDPYVKAIAGKERWGVKKELSEHEIRGRLQMSDYDWEGDHTLQIPYHQVIAYSLHIRGFTRHPSSKVKAKGTFQGVIEKLEYLKDLGINQIHCMPVYEFEECQIYRNYWGYGAGSYFAPKSAYSADGDGARGLKDMVKACHRSGIEVVLEMPFCTAADKMMMLECLRYYVMEYHIDGFILNPFVVSMESVHADPFLKNTKIMEHELGFQTVMRRFLKGDEGMIHDVIYWLKHHSKEQGIFNYITDQNGFTLNDLVSYDAKHNEENGEHNQDGPDYNYSWNCGAEGMTRKKAVLELRKNQMRNAMFLLLLSQGVPCILAGDEFANSQKGNNNVYCQDNPIGWLNWRNLLKEQEMYQFVKQLIKFRKKYRLFHQEKELLGIDQSGCGMPDVSYHGEMAWRAPTEVASRQIGIYYSSQDKEEADCFVAYNMHWLEHEFALPALKKGRKWYRAASTKEGILKDLVVLENQRNIELDEREIVVLVSGKGETV